MKRIPAIGSSLACVAAMAALAACTGVSPQAQPTKQSVPVVASASPKIVQPSPTAAPCAVKIPPGAWALQPCADFVILIEPTGDTDKHKPDYKISFDGDTWVDYDPTAPNSPLSIKAEFRPKCLVYGECQDNTWYFTFTHHTQIAKLVVVAHGIMKESPLHMGSVHSLGTTYTRWLRCFCPGENPLNEHMLVYLDSVSK